MQIPQPTIDTMLEAYKPECRYLVRAELEYPEATGLFKIPSTFYGNDCTLRHLAAVELVLCYNQLSYVMVAEALRNGQIEQLGTIPLEQFKQYQLEDSLIVGIDKLKFRKPVEASEFPGRITVKRVSPKRNGQLTFFKTEFDFGNRSHTGELNFVIKLTNTHP